MANQSKLKAWLRYDGTGRVVTAGPIFQANKPKVGNWRQMNIDLCCNSNGTTTTTTTGGGSNPQPTAFVKQIWTNPIAACSGGAMDTLLLYSASSTLTEGVSVFLDAALTIPVTNDYIIRTEIMPGMSINYIVQNGVLTQFSCIGDYWFASDKTTACSQSFPAQLISVGVTGYGTLNVGTLVFANFSNYGYIVPGTVYMAYNPGFAATAVIVLLSETSGIVVEAPLAC